MGNVRMRAEQINYGASNVKAALDDLDPMDLIALNNRMNKIDAWKDTVKVEEKTGAEVTFTNALALDAVSLSAEIEAVQDLHGQSAPYVGGAGKNKLPMTVSGIKALNTNGTWNGNVYNYRGVDWTILTDNADNVIGIKANGTANQTSQLLFGSFNLVNGTQYAVTDGTTTSGSDYNVRIGNASDAYVTNTNGGTATFTADTANTALVGVVNGKTANNITFLPMIRLSTESDATFAPYSNICPISGRTETSAQTTNDLARGIISGAYRGTDGTYVDIAGYITTNKAEIIGGNTYTARFSATGSDMGILFWDANGNYLGQSTAINFNNQSEKTFVAPTLAKYCVAETNGVASASDSNITITNGTTAYASHTATISFGQTVYGGTLNVTTGVLTVTHAIVNMGDLTYSYNATDKVFYATLGGVGDRLNAISTVFVVASTTTGALLEDGEFMFRTDLDRVYLKCLAYDDVTQFKTAMTGQKICYELATPTTIQLTPTDLQMLKGYNRLSSDTGDITVEAYTGAAWGGDEA